MIKIFFVQKKCSKPQMGKKREAGCLECYELEKHCTCFEKMADGGAIWPEMT